jgi:hypothetical protein
MGKVMLPILDVQTTAAVQVIDEALGEALALNIVVGDQELPIGCAGSRD